MPAKRYPKWLAPVSFTALLALALIFSNQTAPAPNGDPAIINGAQYDAAKTRMEELSLPRLQAYEAGKKLSPDDMAKLREAGSLIDRMIAFEPMLSGLYFLSGKIHHVLGEDTIALQQFRQCALSAPADAKAHPTDAKEIEYTAAEASYQMSMLLLTQGNPKAAFEAADAAVKHQPASSLYLTARASALNELRRPEEAKRDLAQALKIDPSNTRAASLLRFISKP